MLSEVKSIYLSTELLVPPIPDLRIGKDEIISLFYKLREPGAGRPYENLDAQADPPTLSTRRAGGKSQCQIGPEIIRIEEEKPELDISGFIEIVETVLGKLDPNIGPFFAQRCKIHCIAQPQNCENSLELLAGKVANVLDKINPFERPPGYFGVRFRFPPFDPASASDDNSDGPTEIKELAQVDTVQQEHKGFITLRFEAYSQDVKQVWMEASAFYPGQLNLRPDSLPTINKNIQGTYDFIKNNATKFLNQFDEKN